MGKRDCFHCRIQPLAERALKEGMNASRILDGLQEMAAAILATMGPIEVRQENTRIFAETLAEEVAKNVRRRIAEGLPTAETIHLFGDRVKLNWGKE